MDELDYIPDEIDSESVVLLSPLTTTEDKQMAAFRLLGIDRQVSYDGAE